VNSGATYTFTLAPNSGYKVASVNGCGGSWGGSNSYTTGPVTGNCTVSAAFTQTVLPPPQTYTVTASASSNGTISPSGAVLVNSGLTRSFTVTPNSGYSIASMGGTCGGSLNGNTYTTNPITTNCTVAATFASMNGPAVTLTRIAPSGSASPAVGVAVPVSANGSTTFTITPPAGATYASWAGMSDGCGSIALTSTWYVGANLVLKVGPVTGNCTFPVTFAVNAASATVTLTQITPSGSASPAVGTAVSVSANGFTTFTLTPPAGATYASWAGVKGGCGAIAPVSTWYVGSNLALKVGPVTSNCTFPIAFSSK
jgi:hypothetical protein